MMQNDTYIGHAASLIKEGRLVAFPTETVYGLGADATSDTAVAAIFAAKGRPSFNPLIVHILAIEAAERYATVNEMARKLAAHFWPGPLTLVLPRRKDSPISLLASAGLDTVALRSPAHPMARALLAACGKPLAAPSANRSGRISPTSVQHVREELGEDIYILDGGACQLGIESTVVDLTGAKPRILRPGSVTPQDISAVAGGLDDAAAQGILAPGMMTQHYAPQNHLRLNAVSVSPDEALLAFGPNVPRGAFHTENLSENGDLHEAAANLFAMLRKLDACGAKAIAAMTIPENGTEHALGIAINDRLKRAAAR